MPVAALCSIPESACPLHFARYCCSVASSACRAFAHAGNFSGNFGCTSGRFLGLPGGATTTPCPFFGGGGGRGKCEKLAQEGAGGTGGGRGTGGPAGSSPGRGTGGGGGGRRRLVYLLVGSKLGGLGFGSGALPRAACRTRRRSSSPGLGESSTGMGESATGLGKSATGLGKSAGVTGESGRVGVAGFGEKGDCFLEAGGGVLGKGTSAGLVRGSGLETATAAAFVAAHTSSKGV